MDNVERARELFLGGCNCAQAVFAAFCDKTGMDEETALRLSSSFGGGMGRMREVCGACSGIFMIAGMLYGYGADDDGTCKAAHYALIQRLADEFKEKNGTIICRELLRSLKPDSTPTPKKRNDEYYKTRPCLRFVEDAAGIVEKLIEERR